MHSIVLGIKKEVAEEEGFEPPVALTTLVFKTSAFNRSAIPPTEGAGVHQALETFNYLRYYRPRLWWSGVRAAEGGGLLSHCTGRLVPGVRIPPTPPFAIPANSPVKSTTQNF